MNKYEIEKPEYVKVSVTVSKGSGEKRFYREIGTIEIPYEIAEYHDNYFHAAKNPPEDKMNDYLWSNLYKIKWL